ncbi:MAG: holin family protein [Rhodobacteraceae bacterium]|nr:holin family protein [Paracoccaceae bacterium]
MGIVSDIFRVVFGGGRNVVRETAEVFRENAEAGAQRAFDVQGHAMTQFGAEFNPRRRGWFDRFMDGLNRLPRPALALGTLALFISAMVDPLWFASRMQGIALVPDPLWWLLGVIVSFYFGARHQLKAQNFQRDIALGMARAPQVMANIAALEKLRSDSHSNGPGVAKSGPDAQLGIAAVTPEYNLALEDWKSLRAV